MKEMKVKMLKNTSKDEKLIKNIGKYLLILEINYNKNNFLLLNSLLVI